MLPAGTILFSYSMLLCVTMRPMTASPALVDERQGRPQLERRLRAATRR